MDDGEQPMERFDMENDFEGGEWIGGEFFHRGKRQRQSQTKEQAIYGSFMEDSGQWRCERWRSWECSAVQLGRVHCEVVQGSAACGL